MAISYQFIKEASTWNDGDKQQSVMCRPIGTLGLVVTRRTGICPNRASRSHSIQTI